MAAVMMVVVAHGEGPAIDAEGRLAPCLFFCRIGQTEADLPQSNDEVRSKLRCWSFLLLRMCDLFDRDRSRSADEGCLLDRNHYFCSALKASSIRFFISAGDTSSL